MVPLLNSTGYDAWQIILEQRIVTRGVGRVFPHYSKSVGTAFRRSCKALEIDDFSQPWRLPFRPRQFWNHRTLFVWVAQN